MENVTDEILAEYTSKDSLRDSLQKPFLWRGNICATDGHALIMIPGEDPSLPKSPFESIDGEGFFPPEDGETVFTLNGIESLLSRVPLEDEMKIVSDSPCGECDGTGLVECMECGNETNCEDCDGTGKGEKEVPTGKKILREHQAVRLIGETYFSARLLVRLVKTIKYFGETQTTLLNDPRPLQSNIFQVGPAKVLLMPMRVVEDADAESVTR